MSSNISIKKINSTQTYAVRQPILRKGRPIEDCRFDRDDDPSSFHLGVFIKDNLVGVVTYIKKELTGLEGIQYQLRGMAVLKEHQKKGLGLLMLKKGEAIIKQNKGTIVWCNAREVAVEFYIKNGFKIFGKPFDIPKIGLHYAMFKSL